MIRFAVIASAILPTLVFAESTLWGEYVSDSRGVQVAPRIDDEFEIVVYEGGLPGAGWNGKEPQRFLDIAETAEAIIEEMTRIERTSPTAGLAAPTGAVVLFAGPEDADKWQPAPGSKHPDEPIVRADGLLNGGINTKANYRDFTLHVEFLPPFQPERLGNYPGNSGVYIQDRYEIQILDDFGQAMRENSCGAIYRLSEPSINVCYPPGQWQTFDIDFRSARWDDDGKKTENARMTVRQNGYLIHDDVEIANVTNGNHLPETPAPGPIHLQKHGDPVVFRNVWLLPRDEEQLAKRPIVPAFERLAGAAPTAAHGDVLLSELSCTGCHAAEATSSWLYRDRGPDLSQLSKRIHPGWLATYLADPHASKPGTKMPDMLSHLDDAERVATAEDIAAFLLADVQSQAVSPPNWFDAIAGLQLFNRVGCAACHDPAGAERSLTTSVPLSGLATKYTSSGLTTFLKNPHAVRSAGRMPSLGLSDDEARILAAYLLLPDGTEIPSSGLSASIYDFDANSFKRFDKLVKSSGGPKQVGPVRDFGVNSFGRETKFAIEFQATFEITDAGQYQFRIGSDDGSRIAVDGQQIAIVDGTHPYETAEAGVQLDAGVHSAKIDFFQAGGGKELTVEWMKPGDSEWTSFAEAISTSQFEDAETTLPETGTYVYSSASSARGKTHFTKFGCANCHSAAGIENGSRLSAKPLAALQGGMGCVSLDPPAGLPDYDLSPKQIAAINATLAATEPTDVVVHSLATRNCVACHVRDGIGGPEPSRDAYFATSIPEMGNEGRVPPMLDHVGDKLKPGWLRTVLNEGQSVRPYMSVRMPAYKLHAPNHKQAGIKLTDAFVAADQKTASPLPILDEGIHRTRTAGRQLVDNGGLACIKCHSFGDYKGLGIQAVNLLDLTPRLRDDWIHRYIQNPASLRPGTRMPSGFPNGKSVVDDLYGGDPSSQIAAIWTYLAEGKKAAVPKGLLPSPIELKPETAPIIYRNFITGLNPRGIAVGYPEKVNIAFDAESLGLTLLWQNEFIDAAKHWQGRGPGSQRPMGDNVVTYQSAPAIAVLLDADAVWPSKQDKQFLGYNLDTNGRPTFRYIVDGVITSDGLSPITNGDSLGLRRTILTEGGSADRQSIAVRAATSGSIEQANGKFILENGMRLVVRDGDATIRSSNGKRELLIYASADNSPVSYDILW